MNRPDSFLVHLHSLPADAIGFRVLDDGRHVLDITGDITLYVRPGEDDLAALVSGLRKLADAAGEMAGALSSGEDQAAADTQRLAEIRAILGNFDWERDDRQYALEQIEMIAEGGQA